MERLGHARRPALSVEDVRRKRDLMMRILANDARVRALVCPRQDELMRLASGERRAIGAVSYTHLTLPTTSIECRSRWSPYH